MIGYVVVAILLIPFSSELFGQECSILVVVGMPDEAMMLGSPGVEVIVGAGTTKLLRERLNKINPATVRGLISFGVAGGINAEHTEGDIFMARTVLYKNQSIATNRQLNADILDQVRNDPSIKLETGVFVSGDTWLGIDPEANKRLFQETGADLTDHESYTAAKYAVENGIPFTSVRAISDGPDVTLPPAALLPFNDDGSPDLSAILWSVIIQPDQLDDLFDLSKRYSFALQKLSEFNSAIRYSELLDDPEYACTGE